jgi:uncharacterized protein YndB with AHSA1/START domain
MGGISADERWKTGPKVWLNDLIGTAPFLHKKFVANTLEGCRFWGLRTFWNLLYLCGINFKTKIFLKMTTTDKTIITVSAHINATVEKVWACWTSPEHIVQWNNASDDWHTPAATNDLRPGGKFCSTMAARDGSMSFDFEGVYDAVEPQQKIAYTMSDGRRAEVLFSKNESGGTQVVESFEAEDMNAHEMQQAGWQAILDNFKRHAEG